jgi:hypothetical protein
MKLLAVMKLLACYVFSLTVRDQVSHHKTKVNIVTVPSPIFGCPARSQVFEDGPKECGI